MKINKSADTGRFISKATAKADPKGTYVQTAGVDRERIAEAVAQAMAEAQEAISIRVKGILDGIPYRVSTLLRKRKPKAK